MMNDPEEWLPVAGPWVTDLEVEYTADAARTAWYDRAGEYPQRFQEGFAKWLGVAHAMCLPSCTSGLHLALAALNVGPGDEVVLPESTWIATAAPVSYVGATPVFVDVDPVTWCLDPVAFSAAITPRTRVVVPVDLYGNMADLVTIREVAARHDIAVIEDAAEAHGAELEGRRAGAWGDIGVFSFHGSKTLTTGEGGMLVTDDEELFARCAVLRDHGRSPGDRFFFNREVAFKYKMSALQAAFGLAQLERVDELIEAKERIFGWYRDRLGEWPDVAINQALPGSRSTWWMTTVVLAEELNVTTPVLMERLAAMRIDSRPFFHPLSSLPAYAGLASVEGARERNPVAYRLAPRGINLPSGYNMDEGRVDRVCRALRTAIDKGAP